MCQATAIGVAVILLYTSRASYNLVVVALSPEDRPSSFNYGWYNVSDQVGNSGCMYCSAHVCVNELGPYVTNLFQSILLI